MFSNKILKTCLLLVGLFTAIPTLAMNSDQQATVPTNSSWTTKLAKYTGWTLAKHALQQGKTACVSGYNQAKGIINTSKAAIVSLPQATRTAVQENRDAISLATAAATTAYLQPDLALSAVMAAVTVLGMQLLSADTLSTIANGTLVGIVTFSSGDPLTAGVIGATGAILYKLNDDRVTTAIQEANTHGTQVAQRAITLKDQAQQTIVATKESLQRNWDALPEQLRLHRDAITIGATGLATVYFLPIALRAGIDAAISSCTGIVIHQVTSGSELKKLITAAAGSTATFLVLFFGTNVGVSLIDPTGIVLAGGALGTMCALNQDRAQQALEQAGTYTGNAIRATKDFAARHKIDGILALGGLGTIYALLRNNGELAKQLVTNVNTANTAICVFEISFNHFEGQNPNPIRSTMSLTDKGQLISSADSGKWLEEATKFNSSNTATIRLPIQSRNPAISAACSIKIQREHTGDDRLRFTISVVDDESEEVMSAAENEGDPLITLTVTLLTSAGEHKQLTASEAERRILNTIVEVEKDRSFRERVNA